MLALVAEGLVKPTIDSLFEPGAENPVAANEVKCRRCKLRRAAAKSTALALDQSGAQSLLHFLYLAPGTTIMDAELVGCSAQRPRLTDRLQKLDPPVAQDQIAVQLDPELGLW